MVTGLLLGDRIGPVLVCLASVLKSPSDSYDVPHNLYQIPCWDTGIGMAGRNTAGMLGWANQATRQLGN